MTVLIAAHRGASTVEPENSIAAFEAAVRQRADMIEYDVRTMGDGSMIVYHDPNFDGVPLRQLTYADLRTLPVSNKHGRITGGDVPPLFDSVLTTFAGRVIHDIEIKEQGHELLIATMALRRLAPEEFIITSLNENVVANVKQKHPEIKTGLLVNQDRIGDVFERYQRVNADLLCPWEVLCTRKFMARASELGVPLLPWTVNRKARIKRFLGDPNIYGVITDLPVLGVALRDNGAALQP